MTCFTSMKDSTDGNCGGSRLRASTMLFAKSIIAGDAPELAGYAFDLVNFRSINGFDLPSIFPVSRKIIIKRKLRAFVGHRFNNAVTPNLRHNLAIVLKAYGIQPWYSDSDSPNGPVFQSSSIASVTVISPSSTIAKPKHAQIP